MRLTIAIFFILLGVGFAPKLQAYETIFSQTQIIIDDLKGWLCEITGFDSISLQPNAGSQGEYAGLLAIQEYHKSRGDAVSYTHLTLPTKRIV